MKALSILPNTAATTKGLFAVLLGDADVTETGFNVPSPSDFDYDWEEVVPQLKRVTIYLWSADGITAVGAQATLYGKLFPEGEYAMRFP